MNRTVALVLSVAALSFGSPLTAAPPNVVVILTDDMGFSDLGCYGGGVPPPDPDKLAPRARELAPPNLENPAANGLRFPQFYNPARCCPTRASLLTGLYPHQAGVGHMM